MGSPLGPTLANAFLFFMKKWLEQCPEEFKLVYHRRYVNDIFVLFRSHDHLIKFRDYLNKCHPNIKFSFVEEKNGKLSFLDVEVSKKKEGKKFATTIYHKSTFSGICKHFDSFLSTTYKFDMIYTLVFRCFSIFSNWTNFHNELAFLKDIFLKNGYPISSIDKCFKTLLDWVYLKRTQVLTAEKKTLSLFFPFLENCPFKPGQNFKKFSKEH